VAERPANEAPFRLLHEVSFGEDVLVHSFVNLYGCYVGDQTCIGPFVEIQRGVVVGARCKIQSHTFICEGVEIQDDVFVGHGVLFVNDKRPRATTPQGAPQRDRDWDLLEITIEQGASLGSGAILLGGVRVGAGALVGAGAVVTRDVAPGKTVIGIPARVPALANRNNA
jgi:UDP-2-acetamido-3-amino-2,3-dideoxy-glucuronate N-acetyltransferase